MSPMGPTCQGSSRSGTCPVFPNAGSPATWKAVEAHQTRGLDIGTCFPLLPSGGHIWEQHREVWDWLATAHRRLTSASPGAVLGAGLDPEQWAKQTQAAAHMELHATWYDCRKADSCPFDRGDDKVSRGKISAQPHSLQVEK